MRSRQLAIAISKIVQENIANAQTVAPDLILISGPHTFKGRPDFIIAFRLLISLVEQFMGRQDQGRLLRDEEVLLDLQIVFFQLLYLRPEHNRIKNNSVADDIPRLLPENAGRNLMENMFDAVEFKGMTGVGPTLKTRHNLVLRGHNVHNFSLAFISPLKA